MAFTRPDRRRSYLVDVWVEQRDVSDAANPIRGRITSVDSDKRAPMAHLSELEPFILADLRQAGLLTTHNDDGDELRQEGRES